MKKSIVLASTSPRRRDLLRQIGVSFRSVPTLVDEQIYPGEKPETYACRVALEKARTAAQKKPEAIIIGADTIVVLNDVILGKPIDAGDAKRMLGLLSGQMHMVITGVAVVDAATGKSLTRFETTSVWFKQLSSGEISSYIASREPFDKAGAYGIQEKGALFIQRIEGCYFNVVGLPLHLLGVMLSEFGIELM